MRIYYAVEGPYLMKIEIRSDTLSNVAFALNDSTFSKSYWYLYKSVDSLFSVIEQIKKDSAKSIVVSYDSLYGYPKYVYIDPIKGLADEEYGWQTMNIVKIK